MRIFDEIVQVGDKVEITNKNWIEWEHFLIPNKPSFGGGLNEKIKIN